MNVVISCGGTGGHLSPGIAVAEALVARGHRAVLLISQKKVDGRLSEKYPHLQFERMPGTPFGWNPVTFARCCVSQTRAVRYCLALLRREGAQLALGFGGFTSAPLVLAARIQGVPSVLHEANRVPGRAVRTLGRLARRVYLPPAVGISGLNANSLRSVGLPVRAEIQPLAAAEARRQLGLNPAQRVLVVLGGSQGSSPLNDWTRRHAQSLADAGVQVYCVTGLGKGSESRSTLRSRDGVPVSMVFEAFTDRMAVLLSAADLVLSRAGAGTIAELVRCGTPALLVPYPHAADDHQRANAAYFAAQGGGGVVPQEQLEGLCAEVLATILNDGRLQAYRAALQRMNETDPARMIVDDLEQLARGAAAPAPVAR